MDKILKRQIGYKRPGPIAAEKPEKIKLKMVPPKTAPKSNKKPGNVAIKVTASTTAPLQEAPFCKPPVTSEQVIAWIKTHPLFKWSSMCRELGIHAGNFATQMKEGTPAIKPEILPKIVAVLSTYGFNS